MLFNKILFPFTLAFFYQIHSAAETSLTLYFETENSWFIILVFVNILFYTIAIMIISKELSNLFIKKIKSMKSYVGLKDTKNGYVSVYILNYLAIVIFLSFSNKFKFQFFKEVLFIYIFSLFVKFICVRPYRFLMHNLTQIFNMTILLIYLGFMIVKHRMPWTVSDLPYFVFLVFMFSIVVSLNIIMNIFRIISTVK